MVKLVLDASLLSAFFLDEIGGQGLQAFIDDNSSFYAPSFWRFEVSNAVWKRKEIPSEIAERLIDDIWNFNVYELKPQEWVKDAFKISRRYNISFYDTSYIALAKVLNLYLWTLDKLQYNVASKVGVKLW